jgi:hypothetical protein
MRELDFNGPDSLFFDPLRNVSSGLVGRARELLKPNFMDRLWIELPTSRPQARIGLKHVCSEESNDHVV